MTITIRMSGALYKEISGDLARQHIFAAERVGFVLGRIGSRDSQEKLILLTHYHSIPDDQYIDDPDVGARIGSEAMTWAMQAVYRGRSRREGIFHVHMHDHRGPTGMSKVDRWEIPTMIPGFCSVGRDAAHGIIILSQDHGTGWVWMPGSDTACRAAGVEVIGVPIGVFEFQGKQ